MEMVINFVELLNVFPWAELVDHAKSFALPLAGIYVAHKFGKIQADIGSRQAATAARSMATARTKLRLDLFEKRLAIYEAVISVVGRAERRVDITHGEVHALLQAAKSARWLFDAKTAEYIDEIFSDVYSLANVCEDIDGESDPEQIAALRARRKQLRDACSLHVERLQEVFEPYLRFTDKAE